MPVAWAINGAAAEIGIANPSPSASADTAVLIPITAPDASSNGPPLLPGLIAATVCSRSVMVTGRPVEPSATVMVRPVPEMMPRVTVSWGDVWVGAAVTALLFTAGRFLISLYIGKTGIASGFGAAG